MNTDKSQAEQLPQDAVMQSVLKNQVRIGNLVDFNGKAETVYSIRNSGVDFYRGKTKKSVIMQSYVWEAIKPIPLTEEWLLKFRFEKEYGAFKLKGLKCWLTKYTSKPNLYSVNIGNIKLSALKYVHELQNLYFALTGNELTVS